MIFFSLIAYPGCDWKNIFVRYLSVVDALSRELAGQLNSLFCLCAVASTMAACVAIKHCKSKLLRKGVYLLTMMKLLCTVGYECFPWISGRDGTNVQNIIHILVTIFVILLSIISLIIILGTRNNNLKSFGILSGAHLYAMFIGVIGTGVFPKRVFGIFERMSTFSAVVFNAVLRSYLFTGKLLYEKENVL